MRRLWGGDEQVEWPEVAGKVGLLLTVQGAGPAYRGGFGHGGGMGADDATYSAHVRQVGQARQYDVEVDTEAGWPAEMDTWRLLTDWLHGAVGSPQEIEFPFEVRADRWTADVDVDGVAHSFLVVGRPERWVASGRVGDRAVRVRGSGSGSLPVALVSIAPGAVSSEIPDEPQVP